MDVFWCAVFVVLFLSTLGLVAGCDRLLSLR
jgi:hypothetical protein